MSTEVVTASRAHTGIGAVVGDYVKLTKPRVISLLLVTTAMAMFIASKGAPDGMLLLWTMVGGYLAAGGANAINHYVDRDIDGHMKRTDGRPLGDARTSFERWGHEDRDRLAPHHQLIRLKPAALPEAHSRYVSRR